MSRRTCRYFNQNGYCFYGETCQFIHDTGGGVATSSTENITDSSSSTAGDVDGMIPSRGAVSSMSSYAAKVAESPLAGAADDMAKLDLQEDQGTGHTVTEGAEEDEYVGAGVTGVSTPSIATTGMATTGMAMVGDPRYDDEQEEDDQQGAPLLPHLDRGTTYFYPLAEEEPGTVNTNIPTSVFNGVPPFLPALGPKSSEGPKSYFASSAIAEELTRRQMLAFSQCDPGAEPVVEVEQYQQLFRLEHLDDQTNKQFSSRLFHYPTNSYKAMSVRDGQPYCLRHILGYRLSSTASMVLIEKWRKLAHPNVCAVREVFTTKAFGESSLVFIHDYYPGAETMQQRYFNNMQTATGMEGSGGATDKHASATLANGAMQSQRSATPASTALGLQPGLKEPLIWNFVVQLASAVRAVHNAGLACRIIHPTKVIISGESRVRLSSVGIMDVLTFDIGHTDQSALMQQHQQEDLTALGRLILCLTCNSLLAVQSPHIAIEHLAQHYSSDLKNIVIYLLNAQMNRSINNVMPMIGARFFSHIDALMCQTDVLEVELMKELQNGRLFRLLCKFGMINERPEFNMDPQWSETGDRYLLKLFRDYLFHQVGEDGLPWFDLSHVVHCLNQLDAGSPTKICLESRDEQSVIIVSYHDLKQCFESASREVSAGTNSSGHDVEGDAGVVDPSLQYS